jgi:hypothetical protein
MERRVQELCFAEATAIDVGRANRRHWLLVSGMPDADCILRGDPLQRSRPGTKNPTTGLRTFTEGKRACSTHSTGWSS